MRYAFVFPGQGSQSVGMGKELYENFEIAKEMFGIASEKLKVDFTKLLFSENDLLNQTQYTQPAIFLVSQIAHTILQQESPLLAKYALGHSLGEISALCVALGVGFEDGLYLTSKRGELMQKTCEGIDAGMLVVVGLEDAKLEKACENLRKEGKQIWAANYNGDGQVVCAGKKADLDFAQSALKDLGAKRVLLLAMSVASHCPLLEPMRGEFEALLKPMLKENFALPIISNATAQSYNSAKDALKLLSLQLTSPVLYKQSIQSIDNEVDCYIELGHGSVLKGLNKRLSQKTTLNVSDIESLKATIAQIEQNS